MNRGVQAVFNNQRYSDNIPHTIHFPSPRCIQVPQALGTRLILAWSFSNATIRCIKPAEIQGLL